VFAQQFTVSMPLASPRFARVDEARLRRTVELHFDGLWRFLRRLGISEGDVDDGVQEVILVLARKLDQVDEGSERSFMFSTAFRVASDMRRRAKRRRTLEESAVHEAEGPSVGLDPEASAQQRRLGVLFSQVLEQLSLELRVVFVLYELEDFTMAEIAETLGVPSGTVASRLRRGRETFERLAAQVLAEGERS
jgi:RNA polymerase sigma-70 factor (ECF subfamily)